MVKRRKYFLILIFIIGFLCISLDPLIELRKGELNRKILIIPESAITFDTEPNNDFSTAVEVIPNIEWEGFAWWDIDFYNISLNPSQLIEIYFEFTENTGPPEGLAPLKIYDGDHNILNSSSIEVGEFVDLTANSTSGIYFFSVEYYNSGDCSYNLTVIVPGWIPPTEPDIYEPNDDFSSASSLTLDGDGEPIEQLTIDPAGEVDFYSISLNQRDDISISLWNLPANYDLAFFYPNQTLVSESTNTGTADDEINYENAYVSGTYYIRVSDSDNYAGVYNLSIQVIEFGPGEDDLEPNDDFGSATPLTLDGDGEPIEQLTIDPTGEVDFYTIDLNQRDDINIILWNLPANYDLALFYPNQTLVSESTNLGIADDEINYDNAYASGAYFIRVSDSENYAGAYNLSIWVDLNEIPNAEFTVNSTLIDQGDWISCTFTGFPGDLPTQLYQWNFGDGTMNTTIEDPTHQYLLAGEFYITLTIIDEDGESSVSTQIIDVNAIPFADFNINESTIQEGDWISCTFIGNSGDLPTTYEWNFGDSIANVTTQNSTHQYLTSGEFQITLTITDEDGETSSLKKTIIVGNGVFIGGFPLIFGITSLIGTILILCRLIKKNKLSFGKKNL
ncbi:PKD domain-containing protein [Promethearchaeum syntrophicum]|uniref:PKD domain-containing protein n=1 Tax=Promethearchaeum syntrophicum TaxID=2594042 RepID=A0A5B9DBH3_9ARCH|nr:PKD domain-containing protein [Candidatus Prometheoarchaeum syntrophicum]QEE16090.1 PKD domain protein [Candidatus Prometheoarchaeum syntrophicum]